MLLRAPAQRLPTGSPGALPDQLLLWCVLLERGGPRWPSTLLRTKMLVCNDLPRYKSSTNLPKIAKTWMNFIVEKTPWLAFCWFWVLFVFPSDDEKGQVSKQESAVMFKYVLKDSIYCRPTSFPSTMRSTMFPRGCIFRRGTWIGPAPDKEEVSGSLNNSRLLGLSSRQIHTGDDRPI